MVETKINDQSYFSVLARIMYAIAHSHTCGGCVVRAAVHPATKYNEMNNDDRDERKAREQKT